MSHTNVHEQFNKTFNDQTNWMTPTIKYRKIIGNFGVELSSGRGLDDEVIYGVTVLSDIHTDKPKRESGLSAMFTSVESAEEYIGRINGQS